MALTQYRPRARARRHPGLSAVLALTAAALTVVYLAIDRPPTASPAYATWHPPITTVAQFRLSLIDFD